MLRVILEPKTAVFRISEGHVNNYWFSLDFDSIGFVCFFLPPEWADNQINNINNIEWKKFIDTSI